MSKARALVTALSLTLVVTACTEQPTPGPSLSPTITGSPVTSVTQSQSPAPTTFLANGDPLPSGCDGADPAGSQDVAFVAGDRAWALDPGRNGALTCLFKVGGPGPFLWGPRGDRVLLSGLAIRGFGNVPRLNPDVSQAEALDWGHPIGIAVVFAAESDKKPRKLFLDTGNIETLSELPQAQYLDIAYHPSGLALAFVLSRDNRQSIWFSSNEGKDAKRLVFTKEGTTFSDVTFTHDGDSLVYMAHHTAGYSELHTIDLSEPDKLNSVWKGKVGTYVRTVAVSPDNVSFAGTEGEACADRRAVVLEKRSHDRPLLPDEQRPTTVLGWLDDDTLLVGAGGCGEPMDLFSVDAAKDAKPALLVTGVDAAASRAAAPPAPNSLPKEVELDTGSGVG